MLIPAIDPDVHVMTAAEACEFLGNITLRTLQNYVASGKLAVRRIGGKQWHHPDDLREFANPPEKIDLRPGKTSAATKAKLRSQGFKI